MKRVLSFVLTTLILVMMMGMVSYAAYADNPGTTTQAPSSSAPSSSAPAVVDEGAKGAKNATEAAFLKELAKGVSATKADGTVVKLVAANDIGIIQVANVMAVTDPSVVSMLQSMGATAKQAQQALFSAKVVKAAEFRLNSPATITVTVPGVDPGYWLLPLHQKADGSFEVLPITHLGGDKFSITSQDWSPVVFVEYAVVGTNVAAANLLLSPSTGQAILSATLLIAIVSGVGAVGFAVKAKKTK